MEFVERCIVALDFLWLILPGQKIFQQLEHCAIPIWNFIVSPKLLKILCWKNVELKGIFTAKEEQLFQSLKV